MISSLPPVVVTMRTCPSPDWNTRRAKLSLPPAVPIPFSGGASLPTAACGEPKAAEIAPRPLRLLHGDDDTRLAFTCSETIYQWAQEPKEIRLFPGAGHGLQECKEELHQLLGQWLAEKLAAS